ncbi:MAG: iron chelate uptake ABC transporter family permease subunit, partial [Peptidiphaga sp.]
EPPPTEDPREPTQHQRRSSRVGGSGHARLLPLSALLGAMALLTADVLGRVADYPDEIGAGVMAGLIGAPFFVALVRGGRIAGI